MSSKTPNCLNCRFTQIPGFSSALILICKEKQSLVERFRRHPALHGLSGELRCIWNTKHMHLKYKTFSLPSIFSTTDKSQTRWGELALSRVRFTLQLKYWCASPLDFLGFKLNSEGGFCIGGCWFILPPLQSKVPPCKFKWIGSAWWIDCNGVFFCSLLFPLCLCNPTRLASGSEHANSWIPWGKGM